VTAPGSHPLNRLRTELDALFDRFFGPSLIRGEDFWSMNPMAEMDVEETENEFLVRTAAPGFDPKDFDINISGNTLSIRAEHKEETEENKEGEGRQWNRSYGVLQRSVMLPAPINPEGVEAHCRNGILELRLPRAENAQRRRIEVKT